MFFKSNRENGESIKNNETFRSVFPKIMSVVAAIILWIYVVDTQTTIEEKVISGVPVVIENFDNTGNIDIVSGKEHTIEVTVSGTRNDIAEISQKDIVVTADMYGIDSAGTYKLDLNITSPDGVTIVNKSASEVSVTVDRTTTKNAKIEVELLYDQLDDSIYEIGEPILSSSSVQVTGPQNIVDNVEKVVVRINQTEVKNSFKAQSSLIPVDVYGNDVSSPYIKLSQSNVSVRVPVYKTATVRVVPFFDNYAKYSYSCVVNPEHVIIKGEVADIENVESVKTDVISAYEPGTVVKKLDLPDDVTAFTLNGSPVTTVNINILSVKENSPKIIENFTDNEDVSENSSDDVSSETEVSPEETNND